MKGDGNIEYWLGRVERQVKASGDLSEIYSNGHDSRPLPLTGKMVRSRLLLMVADLLGVLGDHAAELAAGIEMIHNASLIHDDVVDQVDLRRGQNALYKTDGNRFAIMAGDVCFAKAMELICRTDHLRIYQAVARSVVDLAVGQLTEWARNGDQEVSFEQYFSVIDKKTGSLIVLCLELPGILARLPEDALERLRSAGRLLGRAFQVADDLLDLDDGQGCTGKDAFSDLAEGKLTYPYLVLFNSENEQVRSLVRQALGHLNFPAAILRQAVYENGLLDNVRDFLTECIDQSKVILRPLFGIEHAQGLFQYFEKLAFRSR